MNSPADEPLPEGQGSLDSGATVDAMNWAMPFTDIRPHASGGLGEVFRATDPELHRTVAVKCLQSRHAENPGSLQRFLLEAEVTARLEHPGVVPVYGFYAGEGRPAYAMRFIEGRTFAEEISLYHAGGSDPVGFRRLLQAFLQICQTLAYAHSRGVIHRDLKPANVMLGKFGETLVVDWGLAKVVGRPEAVQAAGVGETLVPLSGASGTGDTEMGSAVGTPAYMSPEQAAGRWDVVAQASDIYGLGAVLYTLLTDRAPLEKGNWPEMNQKIQRGDIALPRVMKPDVSRALEAICLKAMAVDPEKRYQSAENLAADIEHWMADEPVTAQREPFTSWARRWMKHHRPLVSGVVVLLVAAVVGLSIGAALLQRARLETDKQRYEAVAARGKAESLNRFLIDGLLKQADPVNNPVGDKLTVRELLDQASEELTKQSKLNGQPEVEAELHEVIGHAYEYLDGNEKAELHYRRAFELRTSISGAESPPALATRNRLILAIINLGRLDEAESMATSAYDNCILVLGKADRETAEATNNLAELRSLHRDFKEAIRLQRQAVQIMIAHSGKDDNKTLEFENNLAAALVTAGMADEGVTILQSVVERRRRLYPNDPELATTYANLGGALIGLNRFAEASDVLQNAVSRQGKSRGEKSGSALDARNLYAYALEGEEKWHEAERTFQSVLADRQQLGLEAKQGPAGVERSFAHLARLYGKQKNLPQEAAFLARLLLSMHPEPPRSLESLSASLVEVLAGVAENGVAEPLLRECREAIKLRTWSKDWMGIEFKSLHGDSLRRLGKMAEAEVILLEAAQEIPQAIGAPSWGVAAIRKRLADFYDAAQKPIEAAKWR